MKKKFFRINQQITARELRVIGKDGRQIGIVKLGQALKLAEAAGLDLVEVTSTTSPPVARLVDYKRFLFEKEQQEKRAIKKTREVETKEIRVGPFISDHDLEIRINQARKFLTQGNNFKLTVQFTPRQMRHTEFANKIFDKVKEALGSFARVEREPKYEGRRFTVIFAKSAKNAKSISPAGSSQANRAS